MAKAHFMVLLQICLIWHAVAISHNNEMFCCQQSQSFTGYREYYKCSHVYQYRLRCTDSYWVDVSGNLSYGFHVNETSYLISSTDVIPPNRYCLIDRNATNTKALVCTLGEDVAILWWSFLVYSCFHATSLSFFAITVIVYIFLLDKKNMYQRLSIPLMTINILSNLIRLVYNFFFFLDLEGKGLHKAMSYGIYFFNLSNSTWVNIISFEIWRRIWFRSFPFSKKWIQIVYLSFGNIIPLSFLLCAIFMDVMVDPNPKTGPLSDPKIKRYFINGPSLLLGILSIIYLTLTSGKVLVIRKKKPQKLGLKAVKYDWYLFVKLIVVMGSSTLIHEIKWMLFASVWHVYWIPIDFVCKLQGLWIFILFVLMCEMPRQLFLEKMLCYVKS